MSELAPRIPVSLVSCLPPLLAELSFFYRVDFIIKNDCFVVVVFVDTGNVLFLPQGDCRHEKKNDERSNSYHLGILKSMYLSALVFCFLLKEHQKILKYF